MFSVEMLQANEGDCLLLHYGTAAKPRHSLIDAGRKATWPALKRKLEGIVARGEELELLVVTHIDRDHIEGMLELVADPLVKRFRDIWFNGFHHLKYSPLEAFGGVQGEKLTSSLIAQKLPWNRHRQWASGPVALATADAPVTVTLDSGLRLIVLSPNREQLLALRDEWQDACLDAGIVAGAAERARREAAGLERMGAINVDALADAVFKEDGARPNGSSIAMLAEFDGKRILLGADAHPTQLVAALDALGGPLALDAFKLPHHGSRANLSKGLLEQVKCPLYLVSTSGSYFKHPDREAIARVVKYGGAGAALVFNYESDQTRVWKSGALGAQWGFSARYPGAGEESIEVELAGR
jgi:beta-lactamase superfamily II metal-dependent hydrolase